MSMLWLSRMLAGNENLLQPHNEDVDSRIPIILGSVGLVVSFCGVVATFIAVCNSESDDAIWILGGFPLCCIVLLVACCVTLAYGVQLNEYNDQDYLGKMRVTGIRYEQREFHGDQDCCTDARGEKCRFCQDKDVDQRYYDAYFELDWGYEWACPEFEAKDCSGSEVPYDLEKICNSATCSQDATNRALARLQDRVSQVFDPSATYIAYEATIGPSNDVDWPSIVAYGDCNSCYVQLPGSIASPSHLERLGNISLSLAAIGVGFFVLTCACLVGFCIHERWWKSSQDRYDLEQIRHEIINENAAAATTREEAYSPQDFIQKIKSTSFDVELGNFVERELTLREKSKGDDSKHGTSSDTSVAYNAKKDDKPALSERVKKQARLLIPPPFRPEYGETQVEESLERYFRDLHNFLEDAERGKDIDVDIEVVNEGEYESSRRALEHQALQLPNGLHVPCVCAICLCTYKPGEQITYSPTTVSLLGRDKCTHAFHTSCISAYARTQGESVPCPLCRQTFT